MNQKRLVIITGVYDTLDIFAKELMKEFRVLDYEVMEFNTSDMQDGLNHLLQFLQKPVKAAITFNNLGYNMELIAGQNMWEQLGIPCINILMDHPFFHKAALDKSPSNGIVLCPDRNHMKYVQRFYPNIPIVGYLPHGGIELEDVIKKDIKDRKIDVLYAGGISKKFIESIMPDFTQFDFDAKAIADSAYEMLIDNPYLTTEETIENVILQKGIVMTDYQLCDVLEKLRYVDMMAVSYYREKVIHMLVEHGIQVTLFGTGWEICNWLDNPNLDYRGRVRANDILKYMQDSKIVLNTMTWFKDGTHDRVFNGMLAKAVAVTDSSVYMKEEFKEDELIQFELVDKCPKISPTPINQIGINDLPDKIQELLSNPSLMQTIADKGYEKAVKGHSWKVRARELHTDLLSQI